MLKVKIPKTELGSRHNKRATSSILYNHGVIVHCCQKKVEDVMAAKG